MASREVWLTIAPEYEGEKEHKMTEIPVGPLNGEDVAYETMDLVQRAYEMGRLHQMEIMERELAAMSRGWRKVRKSFE